jgi:hypothetical protein
MRRTVGDGAAEVGIVGDCNVQSSVSRWLAAAFFAFWAALAGLSGVVRADSACHIGKPLYCMKYAGMICPKENPLPNAAEKCAEWQQACFECHGRISACLGGARPPAHSPLCDNCENEWRACMHGIDAKYWPNRRGNQS